MSSFQFRMICLSLCAAGTLLRADVLVTTSMNLTSFSMTPAAGSIQFIAPLNSPPGCTSPSLCATAFAQAQDSLGGFDQQYNQADNGATSATAATALANAAAAASAPAVTGSASSGVNIVGIAASASSQGLGTLYGTFEITGTTGNVSVDFSASLTTAQHLKTDNFGQSASSEVIFTTQLGNGDIPLFFDLPYAIGSDQEVVDDRTLTLTNTDTLQANTPYSLVLQVDAESQGVNNAVPEPSAAFLLFTVLGFFGLIARRKARQRVPQP